MCRLRRGSARGSGEEEADDVEDVAATGVGVGVGKEVYRVCRDREYKGIGQARRRNGRRWGLGVFL